MTQAQYRYGRRQRRSVLSLLKIPLVLLGALGTCAFLYTLIAIPPREVTISPTATPVAISTEQDIILGDPAAPVRFFLYCDLTGRECAKFHEEIEPELRKNFIDTKKVALVFRNTPQKRLATAHPAAHAVMCANSQGKFWEMYAKLLESQSDWSRSSSKAPELFANYAQELGLEMDQFKSCYEDEEFKEAIEQDIADAKEVRAFGTYSFRVNNAGPFAGFRDYEFIQDVIAMEISE